MAFNYIKVLLVHLFGLNAQYHQHVASILDGEPRARPVLKLLEN